MISSLLFSSVALAASPFGGAELAFQGEFDGAEDAPAELLVQLDVNPVQIRQGSLRIIWAPTELSWGIAPTDNRFDRLQIGVMSGRKGFSSGNTSASWYLGQVLYDRDADFFDLTFGGGGVNVKLADELLTLYVGGDLRLRSQETNFTELFDDEPNNWGLLLGVPVGLRTSTDELPGPLYASADARLRPAVGLAGNSFVFDSLVKGEVGVLLVDEDEINFRVFLGYQNRFDTFNQLPYAGMEHRVGLGGRARF